MRRIAVLDAPSNLGLRPPTATSVPGCAKAPGALRDHGLLRRLNARDAGCLTPPRYDPGDWRPGDGVCHAPEISAYSRKLADRIGAILDLGEFPVVLGGDCSIVLGSALAMHRLGEAVGGRIGLVFVDGHSDFRHPGNASYVGAAAGEDLALVTGRGQTDLAAMEGRRPYYRDIDVVVMGIRAQDEYRLDLQAAGIVTRPVPTLRVEGAARSAQWARDQLVDCAGYWVHIDVDVLDPAVMPAVDAPEPGGIAFPELEILLAGLVESPHCLGVEITVFDPDYDPDGRYAEEITSAIVAGLKPAQLVDARPDLIAARRDLAGPGRLGPGRLSPGQRGNPAAGQGEGSALGRLGNPAAGQGEGSALGRLGNPAAGQGGDSASGRLGESVVPGARPVLEPDDAERARRAAAADDVRLAAMVGGGSAGGTEVSDGPATTLLGVSDAGEIAGFPAIGPAADAAADAAADRAEQDAASDRAEFDALSRRAEVLDAFREDEPDVLSRGAGVADASRSRGAGVADASHEGASAAVLGGVELGESAARLGGVELGDREGDREVAALNGEPTGWDGLDGTNRGLAEDPAGLPDAVASEPSGDAWPDPEGSSESADGAALEAVDDHLPEPAADGDPGAADHPCPDPAFDAVDVSETALADSPGSDAVDPNTALADAPGLDALDDPGALPADDPGAQPAGDPARTPMRPLGSAPLLDSKPLPATMPGMLRPRSIEDFTLPAQRPAFEVGPEQPADLG